MIDGMKNHKKISCIIILIICGSLYYCLINKWLYYYFDVIAKCTPALAGYGAYYMWTQNREKELKNLEYRNDYYKKIIDKRMEAYEQLEEIIAFLKVIAPDNNHKKMYHVYFSTSTLLHEQTMKILEVVSKSIWLSENINYLMMQFNQILYLFPNNDNDKIREYAIKKYHEIAVIREELEKNLAIDLLKLHEVEKFLDKQANLDCGLISFRTK